MKVNEFDVVELVDGRTGTVLEVFEHPPGYLVIDDATPNPESASNELWSVEPCEIKIVLWTCKNK